MEAPPVITVSRPRFPWLWAGTLALLAVAGGMVFFFFNPSQYGFYPRCWLHSMTGLECPGCGSQRAVYHLFHGHLAMAFRHNALLVAGLPLFIFGLVRFIARWMATDAMPTVNIPLRWIKVGAIVIILFGILRNIPCAPFIYLAPP
jgi:hypothetical protein